MPADAVSLIRQNFSNTGLTFKSIINKFIVICLPVMIPLMYLPNTLIFVNMIIPLIIIFHGTSMAVFQYSIKETRIYKKVTI